MITEQEIYEKYPKIFGDRTKPMTETCMCWGLAVPERWFPIIDELCDAMTNYAYTVVIPGFEGTIKFPQVVAQQVKEKFNSLRFYYRLEYEQENVPDDVISKHYSFIDGMIAYAENKIDKLEEQ